MPPEERELTQIRIKRMLRNFAIEIIIYGTLVILYYFLALRLLSSPLVHLFREYLPAYALVSLILITAQGVLLESLTSFLLKRLGLQRLE
jgi:hypothetical protein